MSEISQPELQILGVTHITNSNTEFEDESGEEISASEFFGQALGAEVKAEGTFDGQVLVVDEIELR